MASEAPAAPAVVVTHPDTPEKVEKEVVDEVKADETSVKIVPRTVDEVVTTTEHVSSVAEEKSIDAPLVTVIEVDKLVASETVEEEKLVAPASVEPVVEEVTIAEVATVPAVEEKLVVVRPAEEVTKALEHVKEEKPVAAAHVKPIVEEKIVVVAPVEEVTKSPVPDIDEKPVDTAPVETVVESVVNPATPPSVQEVAKPEEVLTAFENVKPVATPSVEEHVKPEDVAEQKPLAPPASEDITTTDTTELVEEDKQITDTVEPVKEETPATIPAVIPQAIIVPLVEATREKPEMTPEAATPVPEPVVSEAVDKVVETPAGVTENSERSLELPSVEEKVVEPIAAIIEKKDETEPVSAVDVPESVKAEFEAVLTELTKAAEPITSSLPETTTGRTLAEKLNEEKTTSSDSERVQEPPKSNTKTDDNVTNPENVTENVESDEQINESETKTDREQRAEAENKTEPKQSTTLLSKVKKSLVKAKKAITGKSPGSKNTPPVTNEDLELK